MSIVTRLDSNQYFIFGSNATGFHGAGAAGFACRGTAENNWKKDPWFLRAMESPEGSPDRVGRWAVFGVGRGYQRGREGASYAIQTITRPGVRRSVPLQEIRKQFVALLEFCKSHPDLQGIMTPVGAEHAGYSSAEMLACFKGALVQFGQPTAGILIPSDLYLAA